MLVSYQTLKTCQRAVRKNYPVHLSFRVDKALSWLNRTEQCGDDDGRFIFLWMAFNAAYANQTAEIRITVGHRASGLVARLIAPDSRHQLAENIWNHYSGAICILLDTQFFYQLKCGQPH